MKKFFKKPLTPHQLHALKFILSFGYISLLADVTYEGARSIIGAYLGYLGASAAIVGFVAGFGEFIGYGLRFVSGYLVDRTQKYWAITILGYLINLLVVPSLALTNHWISASVLIIAERIGKAIRVPGRDAMLSYGAHSIGMGLGFGIHKTLDQIGAMLGPLLIAGVLYFQGSYHTAFAFLGIPAALAIIVLFLTRFHYPQPKNLEISDKYQTIKHEHLNKTFWIYVVGACFIGAGFADFALIAFHFQKTHLFSSIWIPLSYAIAMGINSLFSPLLGYLYDRKGFIILIGVTVIAALFAPFVFLGNAVISLLGVILWAFGISTQQSLMRAIIGKMIVKDKRGSAYGMFNMLYGMSWFIGSTLMGILYDRSIGLLVGFIMSLQILSLPWLWYVMKKQN